MPQETFAACMARSKLSTLVIIVLMIVPFFFLPWFLALVIALGVWVASIFTISVITAKSDDEMMKAAVTETRKASKSLYLASVAEANVRAAIKEAHAGSGAEPTEKDYYAVLGVLPSIDDVALSAVYRALLKKYQPDVFIGSKAEAEKRTVEINEAYDVLGKAESRRAYDNSRKNNGFGSYQQEDTTSYSNDVTAAWELVKKYYPGTEELRLRLSRLSRSLAFTFQITALDKKKFDGDAKAIAAKLEKEFLERYFGKSSAIHDFVREALIDGRSDVAKEVNHGIRTLGTPSDPTSFIVKVRDAMKYNVPVDSAGTEPPTDPPERFWRDQSSGGRSVPSVGRKIA